MFVLADIEWMTNAAGHFSPTQLAAIRVDGDWNEVARFHALIRPRDGEFHDWSHVSYSGATPADFLHARNAHNVLVSFLNWLAEDDVVLWWYNESDKVFNKLHRLILKRRFEKRTISIQDYVYAFLHGQPKAHGNAYQIAEARGILTNPTLKHYAINDAEVMRKLMKKIAYPQSDLLKPVVRPEIARKPEKPSSELPYQYDAATNMIHLKDCPALPKCAADTIGFETWKAPLKKGFRPCDCCKEDYRAAFRKRNMDILDRTQYTYVYTKNSTVFHKYSCGIMLSAKSILGAKKHETVVGTGRKPCKLCNPSPEDVYRPLPLQEKISRLQKKTKKLVSKEDAKAILRHRVAVEERDRSLKDVTLTEQERNDVFTLTQPRFAFWRGKGYRTFHLRACPKLRELANLRGFATYKEAVSAGYAPCRKCKPTAKHDVKLSIPITNQVRTDEKIEDLEGLCRKAGYPYHRESAYLYLETPVGKWRIHVSESPVKLDHINLVKTPGTNEYHEQPRIFLSFLDTFHYIKRHDENLAKKLSERLLPSKSSFPVPTHKGQRRIHSSDLTLPSTEE